MASAVSHEGAAEEGNDGFEDITDDVSDERE